MTSLAHSPTHAFPAPAGTDASASLPALRLPRGHDSADAAVCASLAQTSLSNGTTAMTEHKVPPPPSDDPSGPFEGPEKLLELWFAPLASQLPAAARSGRFALVPGAEDRLRKGLRAVPRAQWEEMLDLVSCKVLSVLEGDECDAFLLSESSMFVFPHKIVLKTCGTTTLLLGLERVLRLAHWALGVALPSDAGAEKTVSDAAADEQAERAARALGGLVQSAFYSRKSFMFPERQKGPHRDWMLEVAVLDRYLDGGAAYTVGKMNGDHWLLYMATSPVAAIPVAPTSTAVSVLPKLGDIGSVQRPLSLANLGALGSSSDQTLEVLMTHLSPRSCARFAYPTTLATPSGTADRGHALGALTSDELGLSTLFPNASLDAFAFEPCGYSANALVPSSTNNGAGYWTVHVTPEEGSSYASFETNVEVRDVAPAAESSQEELQLQKPTGIANFEGLVARVVDVFEPGRLSVTLFTSTMRESETSSEAGDKAGDANADADEGTDGTSTLNASVLDAGSVLHALELPGYRRTDRIAYEFEDYDLVFVSFDRRGSRLPRR